MAIQEKKHEITVAGTKQLSDFVQRCKNRQLEMKQIYEECKREFNADRMYVDQALKVQNYFAFAQSSFLKTLVDEKIISIDVCLRIIQCAEANGLEAHRLAVRLARDLKDKQRISRGAFDQWRKEQPDLRLGRNRQSRDE